MSFVRVLITYPRLEVSMKNFSIMSMLNSQRNLDEQLKNFTFAHEVTFSSSQKLIQVATFD
jgi:hypothetical protein